MRRKIAWGCLVLLLIGMFSGCARTRFQCGICGKEVNGIGHLVNYEGKTGRICDDCYRMMQELQG